MPHARLLRHPAFALLAVAVVVVDAACEPVLEGAVPPTIADPTPDALPLDPPILCQEQHPEGGTVVSVAGNGFAPIPFGLPADPQVALPDVALVGAQDLAGDAADLGAVLYSGTPGGANAELLSWQSTESMALVVKDAVALAEGVGTIPAGLYDVTITNADGRSATSASALAVTPRPSVELLTPPLVCVEQGARSVTLTGANALRLGAAAPTVRVGELSLTPTLNGCVDVPHPGIDASLCSSLTVELAEDSLAPGAYAVSIENPAPATCTSAAADDVDLIVVAPPAITDIEPALACNDGSTVDLVVTGTGFLTVNGAPFIVTVGGTTTAASNLQGCEDLAVTGLTVQTCTSFVVTVDPATLVEGLVEVTVTNPEPAGCNAVATDLFAVVPPPALASVDPTGTCAGAAGLTDLVVTGSGFLRVDGADFGVIVGGAAVTPTNIDGCVSVPVSNATAELCTSFTVSVDASALPVGGVEIVVTNPAPADCGITDNELFVVVPTPTISTIEPPGVCSLTPGVFDFTVSGAGFLRADAGDFTVTVAGTPVTPANVTCTNLQLADTLVESCDSFTFSIDTTGLAVGPIDVDVTNPEVRECGGTASGAFEILGPPTVTAIAPDQLCSDVVTTFDVIGQGLALGTIVTVNGEAATNVAVNDTGTILTVQFPSGLPAGTYDIGVSNGSGCDALLPDAITVNPTPLVFFVDPPIAFNGIDTEATIFASDVTEAVTNVDLIDAQGNATALTFSSPDRPQRIVATIPAGLAAGDYEVAVTSADGCASTLNGSIQVTDATTIDIVSADPKYVSPTVPTAVTITVDPAGDTLVNVPRVYLSSSTGTGNAIAVRAVELLDPTSLSAVVTGAPPDTYNLIVVNPTGEVGLELDAVIVNADEPPVISSVAPGSLDANGTADVVIRGASFDAEPTPVAVTFDCIDFVTNLPVTSPTAIVNTATAEELDVTVNGAGVPAGAVCVVIATNADGANFRFSAISYKEPAQNLNSFVPGAVMAEARRGLVLAAGRPTETSRFIYAIGGDDGIAANAKTSIEAAQVDAFGGMREWTPQRNTLPEARTLAGGATIGRFVYIVGGDNGAGPVDTVLRAQILDPLAGPEIVDLDAALGDGTVGLGEGLYLYRVSALFPVNDPLNPGGESLAGEQFNVDLPAVADKLVLTLTWTPVSGASGYRLYRTPLANQTADDLELLAELDGNASTTFTDDDTAAPDPSITPMPAGSLGVWHPIATLGTARAEHATLAVASPTPGQFFLYAVGGQTPGGVTGSGEFTTVTVAADGSQTLSSFSALTASLNPPRREVTGMSIRPADTPVAGSDTFLFFACGRTSNGQVNKTVEGAAIEPDGDVLSYTSVSDPNPARVGAAGLSANGFMFLFGGANGTASNNDASTSLVTAAPSLDNWDGLGGGGMIEPRVKLAATQESAFFFVGGGVNQAGTPLATIERTIQ